MSAALREEVLAAAARGWRLLPVRAGEKTPLVKDWPTLATSDISQIEKWAARFPACNWGVATGPGSGVFGLDVDGNRGRAALKAYQQQRLELPETLTVSTGRGKHLYFCWPEGEGIRNSAGRLAAGLDVRGDGGYLVIPPSVHNSGTKYAYAALDAPVANAPDWLLSLIQAQTSPQSGPSAPAAGAVASEPIGEGSRTNRLVSLAGSMHKRGMDPAAIEAALLVENAAKCSPPLPEAKVRAIARDIPKRYPNAPPATGPARCPLLVCLSDVESKPVDWLWEPYLPKGMLALLSGDPGSGKTFLSLAIAAALSNGRTPHTQEVCELVSTLYLSLENSAEHVVRPRFDSLTGDCSHFHILQGSISGDNQPDGTISLTDTDLLEHAIISTQAGLLIVDPIQSYLGADVDAHRSNETRPVLDGLARLASQYNCCILLVRHLSKSSGGRAIHRGLGSIDITGAARTELMSGTAPNEPNSRAMVQVKNNLGPYGDSLGFTIREGGFAWTGKSNLTSGDLLAPEFENEARSEIARAVDFLTAELANGPKLQKELVEQSEFSERTLQRAARKVSVKKEREGERGPWRWSLR